MMKKFLNRRLSFIPGKSYFIVPTPLEGGGGEELYTQMGFFVQSILADR